MTGQLISPPNADRALTWNKELIARIGEVEAKEAVALGYTNIYSPILDIAQDPRWGNAWKHTEKILI